MELPFLYGYGALVWKALLVVLVLLSLALVAALRSWLARRNTRRALAALVPTELCEGDVVLRGKIVQGSASTLTQELEQSSERSSGLVIVHEGVRVVIEGDVQVTHGSRARRWWLRPPRGVNAKWCWSSTQRTVVVGDEVIVSGTLARVPDVAGYRDSASHWELAGTDGPAMIAACRSQTKALPLGMGRWLAGTFLFGAIWYGVLHHAGTKAIAIARDEQRSELAPHDALALAAAMPGSRDEAFELLDRRFESSFEKTEEAFQLRLRLLEDRGQCPAYMLYRASRFEEAAAVARRCDPNLVKHALLYAGHYREAGALAERGSYIAAVAAIADGRWADAALYADRAAKDFEGRAPTHPVTKEDLASWAADARCVAALFRAWSGDSRAFVQLDDRTGACLTARALTAPIEMRGEALAAVTSKIDPDAPGWSSRRARTFALAYGARARSPELDFYFGNEKWFLPFVLQTNPDNRSLHEDASIFEIERGNRARARHHAARAFALTPPEHATMRRTVELLEARASIDPNSVHFLFEDAARIRKHERPRRDILTGLDDGCAPSYARAIEDAQHGDGRALAAVHRRCRVFALSIPSVLFGVLPLVDRGRAELAKALRFYRADVSSYQFPFSLLESAWWTRDISRMVGDMDEYDRWKAIYDRHAAVLANREKLIALTILNEL